MASYVIMADNDEGSVPLLAWKDGPQKREQFPALFKRFAKFGRVTSILGWARPRLPATCTWNHSHRPIFLVKTSRASSSSEHDRLVDGSSLPWPEAAFARLVAGFGTGPTRAARPIMRQKMKRKGPKRESGNPHLIANCYNQHERKAELYLIAVCLL